MSRRYFWDFYGGSAEGTARHFHTHLDDFLARNAITGCTTGVEQPGKSQFAAWCEAPEEHGDAIRRALRPRREAEGGQDGRF